MRDHLIQLIGGMRYPIPTYVVSLKDSGSDFIAPRRYASLFGTTCQYLQCPQHMKF
jgi:hypothetical protein